VSVQSLTWVATWRLPILMYHSVSHSSVATALPGAVSHERLDEQLGALREAGYTLVGLTEALALAEADPTRKVAALTFDDGLLDFLNAAYVLGRHEARATLYVPTALVGTRAPLRQGGHRYLSWADLKALSAAGIEMGSHTLNHRPLDVHPARTVRTEIRDSKAALEDRLGTAVTSFSYPHGYQSGAVVDEVAQAGYDNACIVGRRIARSSDDRWSLPRIEARPHVDGAEILDLVQRGERGLAPGVKRAAMPAWRLARKTAFTVLSKELT
jgi:peptidoglycan/xylan/chitin deacetylase (PgdA/CDA1 family)